ncbi:hypothetical protein FS837_010028 [Tulasnella sp. UAMH 9824]|nr:hypothetical protein FS837_010028 [Tulasnella sp. UAMH 9824]
MSSPSLRLGSVAPDFSADTTQGRINFHEWIGDSWAILFSHPADFTPVCTTELGEVSRRAADFAKRNVKVIGLSANDLSSHEGWIKDINSVGNTDLKFPIIADADRKVSVLYDMLDQQDATNIDGKGLPFTATVSNMLLSKIRTVFIIDPAKKIRLTLSYPAAVGRNFDEIIRAVDALQLGDNYRIATPVNWQPGQDVIVNAAVKDDEAKKLFPDYKAVLPYLRTTEDPSRKA